MREEDKLEKEEIVVAAIMLVIVAVFAAIMLPKGHIMSACTVFVNM